MAKREPIQKQEPIKQRSLFGNKPTSKWSPFIDRPKVDLAMRTRIKEGRATYLKTYNSFKCLICNTITDRALEIRNSYCMNCDVLHDIDYVSNSE